MIWIPNMNHTPFSQHKLFATLLLACLQYFALTPYHELGHYRAAKEIASSKNIAVEFRLKRNYISCSNWKLFKEDEQIQILKAGAARKIKFCRKCFIVAAATLNFVFAVSWLYVILYEYIQNCTPLFKTSDCYKIYHLDKFVEEPKYMDDDESDSFYKNEYPNRVNYGFNAYFIFCIILFLFRIFCLNRAWFSEHFSMHPKIPLFSEGDFHFFFTARYGWCCHPQRLI